MNGRILSWVIPVSLAFGCVAAQPGEPGSFEPTEPGAPRRPSHPSVGLDASVPAPTEGDDDASAPAPPTGDDDVPLPVPPTEVRPPVYNEPGSPVMVSAPTRDTAAFAELAKKLSEARAIDREAFDRTYAVPFSPLSYDPLTALNLERIRASEFFTLDEAALARLKRDGFVIASQAQPYFNMGYDKIYTSDLPVYVSADSLLQAVHESYGDILKTLESHVLAPTLSNLLDRLALGLSMGKGALGTANTDLDVYLTIARSLLSGMEVTPLFPQNRTLVRDALRAIQTQGLAGITLFGVSRVEDGSQFTPRGHYADSVELQRYFQATMWLGRVDLRLIETESDGTQRFRRPQVDAMFALADLFDSDSLLAFNTIDAVVREFVGESDSMTLDQVPRLLADLGVTSLEETLKLSDQQIAQALVQGGYGNQRIASHAAVHGDNAQVGTLPLNRSFTVLGQRYAFDSHVFSNVVFDRIGPLRYLPDPLDAAFAAMANDQAADLLKSELDEYGYQGALNAMRVAGDHHEADYWDGSLYTRWLSALRTLSPAKRPAGLPPPMETEAWGRRLLNTQLASWAQLRHDTILYVKQSYTPQNGCEYPDAYIDPYPEFYAGLAKYAERGLAMADKIAVVADAAIVDRIRDHFTTLRGAMQKLGAMAQHELTGVPFDADQLAFINDAVRYFPVTGCGQAPRFEGWYPRLFFAPSITFNPTIADVHTDNNKGEVLHVGTGGVYPMVVTVETCEGPRAYVGYISSYHELIGKDYKRFTDREFADSYWSSTPPFAPWMRDLMP